MQKTLAALYPTLRQASVVLNSLKRDGFDDSQLNLITRNAAETYTETTHNEDLFESATSDTEEAAVGAGIGAVVGSITGAIAIAATIAIPGVGPVIASGAIASLLVGTGVGAGLGAAVGSVVGALVDFGVPKEDAELLAEGLRKGGSLVMVSCSSNEEVTQALKVLHHQKPVDLDNVPPSSLNEASPSTASPKSAPDHAKTPSHLHQFPTS